MPCFYLYSLGSRRTDLVDMFHKFALILAQSLDNALSDKSMADEPVRWAVSYTTPLAFHVQSVILVEKTWGNRWHLIVWFIKLTNSCRPKYIPEQAWIYSRDRSGFYLNLRWDKIPSELFIRPQHCFQLCYCSSYLFSTLYHIGQVRKGKLKFQCSDLSKSFLLLKDLEIWNQSFARPLLGQNDNSCCRGPCSCCTTDIVVINFVELLVQAICATAFGWTNSFYGCMSCHNVCSITLGIPVLVQCLTFYLSFITTCIVPPQYKVCLSPKLYWSKRHMPYGTQCKKLQ